MNKLTKKLACIALAGTMGLTSLAGCGNKAVDGTKPLVTCKEDIVTVGAGNMMLRINQASMLSYYTMFGGSAAGIWDQDAGNGKTYGESTKEGVIENYKDMLVLKQHGEEYKVSVSEEEQKKIKEAAGKFMKANSKETLKKLAVTQEDIEQYLTLYTYQNKMYDPMTADVDTNVEESEAAQSTVSYIKIDLSDKKNEDGTTTPLTDEEKQAKKATAQEVLDKIQNSGKVAEADMGALAKEVDESLNLQNMSFGADDKVLDNSVKEAVKDLKDGELCKDVIEGEKAYYVVRMDKVLDTEATEKNKESIVKERKNKAYSDLLEKWKKEADITVDEKEWKKVTLTDNDLYTMKQPETGK